MISPNIVKAWTRDMNNCFSYVFYCFHCVVFSTAKIIIKNCLSWKYLCLSWNHSRYISVSSFPPRVQASLWSLSDSGVYSQRVDCMFILDQPLARPRVGARPCVARYSYYTCHDQPDGLGHVFCFAKGKSLRDFLSQYQCMNPEKWVNESIKSMNWRYSQCPDSKVHGANMGPTWVLSAPDGPHIVPMNPTIWDITQTEAVYVSVIGYTEVAEFTPRYWNWLNANLQIWMLQYVSEKSAHVYL